MTVLVYSCLLSLGGVVLPWWAWAFALAMALTDVVTSPISVAFWRGLKGQ